MTAPSLIDELLAEQQSLTAVESFARVHDQRSLSGPFTRYRALIPLEQPKPGEQYAFEVELDKCSGCKACVTACHSLNGLDDNETWREVGLLINDAKRRRSDIVGGTSSASPHLIDQNGTRGTRPSMQHVTTACHHCVDPACLNGCPVLAYEKDAVTGIVRHLDDQCIGCQYCVLKCPYDVPKYNARLGIVRKCDMCSSRLAVGEAPACVQACPGEAIRITTVSTSAVTIEFRERGAIFLSSAPAGDYTLPTTRYVRSAAMVGRGVLIAPRRASESGLEGASAPPRRAEDSAPCLMAADSAAQVVQPAHWPLVVMLVLSQASVGAVAIAAPSGRESLPLRLLALVLAVVGLGASVFHLGRPFGAWRAFLNLRRSWMSREIIVLGLFAPLLAVGVLMAEFRDRNSASQVLSIATAMIGVCGVFCSVMIYHDTRRPLWHWQRGLPLFFGTTLALGAAGAALFDPSLALLGGTVAATVAKLGVEILTLRHVTDRPLTPLKKTALLITGRFQHVAFARLLCAALGGIGLPLLLTLNVTGSPTLVGAVGFAFLLAGELLERFLFFTTVVAPKMPGGSAA